MKRIILIFLMFVQLFLGVNSAELSFEQNPLQNNSASVQSANKSHNTISVDLKNYESAVLQLNKSEEEIFAHQNKNKNQSLIFGNPQLSQKISSKIFNNENNSDIIKNYGFISYLSNEICTRAP